MIIACAGCIPSSPKALQTINSQALGVGLLALSFCLFTPKKISRFVPGSLLGLIAGTLTAIYLNLGELYVICASKGANIFSEVVLSARNLDLISLEFTFLVA